jgi:hypothetical protein
MNLFFLDTDPKKCAEYHCDKHVVKMVLEIVQMLYTAHILLETEQLPEDHYKPISNTKHPTSIWIRSRVENYNYSAELAVCLAEEYTYRYKRIHSCEKHARWLKSNIPNFSKNHNTVYKPETKLTYNKYFNNNLKMSLIPLAMPDDSKLDDPINSYRKYYHLHKKHFVRWTDRPIPYWFTFSDIRKYFK